MNADKKSRLVAVIIGGLLLSLFVTGVVYAATINIDTFDSGTQNIAANDSNTPVYDSVDGGTSDVLGQYRDVALASSSCSAPSDIELKIDVGSAPGTNFLDFSEDTSCGGIATITWDGDNDATARSYLLSADLEDSSPTNDGIYMKVTTADHATQLTMVGYENSTQYSTLSINIAGSSNLERLDIFFPFNTFSPTGGGAVWSDLEALELEIDGTVEQELQFVVDYMEATDDSEIREYGDLPDGTGGTPDYSDTTNGDNELAAYHSNPMGLTLGYNVDIESSSNADYGAKGDDNSDADDEDGVEPVDPYRWDDDGYGQVEFTINGCPDTSCYVNGWIDWNNDGSFDDTVDGCTEHVVNEYNSGDGTRSRLITCIPSSYSNVYYYARFRICEDSGQCNDPGVTDTNVPNGEIEDYRWPLGPTAVELSAFDATWSGSDVLVTWETAMEIDTVGFNVWRSTTADGSYVKANDTLIPAASPGGVWGGSYAFTDPNVLPGTTYYYKLEEIEAGKEASNWYGPVSTDEGDPNAVTLSAADTALAWWPVAAGVAAGTGVAAIVLLRRRRASS
ncbi:MAG: hypothetical protein JW918_15555 [Anaerolineae bacterium]|nr:hypothetical protein [Anaerolineae bacterium]